MRKTDVGFTVDTMCRVGQFKIVQSSGAFSFDSIAVDIVKELPLHYFPGFHEGKRVNCQSVITISHSPN